MFLSCAFASHSNFFNAPIAFDVLFDPPQGAILDSCFSGASLLGLVKSSGSSLEKQLNFTQSIQFVSLPTLASDFTFPAIDTFVAAVAALDQTSFAFSSTESTEQSQVDKLNIGPSGSSGCTKNTYTTTNYWTECLTDPQYNTLATCRNQCTNSTAYRNMFVWLTDVRQKSTALNATNVALRARVVAVNAQINGISQVCSMVRDESCRSANQ